MAARQGSKRHCSSIVAVTCASLALVATLWCFTGGAQDVHAWLSYGRRFGETTERERQPTAAAEPRAQATAAPSSAGAAAASAAARALNLANVPDGAGALVPPVSSLEPRTFVPSQEGACLKLVHIPKTGGTTLEDIYQKNKVEKRVKGWGRFDPSLMCAKHVEGKRSCKVPGDKVCNYWHTPPRLVEGLWMSGYQQCDTFCVIRHPLDRVVSEWQYKTKTDCSQASFTSYVGERLRSVISGGHYIDDCHWVPMHEYVYDYSLSKPIRTCRHILRFERMEDDFAQLMKAYNYSLAMPPQHHNSKGACDINIPPDIQEMIRTHYAADYGMFGYD